MKSGECDVREIVANDCAKVKVKNKMADAKRSQNWGIPGKFISIKTEKASQNQELKHEK